MIETQVPQPDNNPNRRRKGRWREAFFDGSQWTIAVGGGLVTTLLLWAIPRLLNATGPYIINFVGRLSQSTVDRTYKIAVFHPEYQIYAIALLLFTMSLVSLFTLSLCMGLIGPERYRRLGRKFHFLAKSQDVKMFGVRMIFFARLYLVVASIFLIGSLSIFFVISNESLIVSADHDRRMLILYPYVSDQKRAELLGNWGRVQTEADYHSLMMNMDKIATEHRITLPKRSD